ncbi:MAG: indole-3-glycerol phosphate synthase TrpC [Planctomycetota bacterium]
MILDEILHNKRKEVDEAKRLRPLPRPPAGPRPDRRDFRLALATGGIRIIAEVKRASPSAGVLCADLDPAQLARTYEDAGASALSVLTDAKFFHGSLADLRSARAACALPVLRKDFLIDPYQVYEANDAGADAILLIVRALGAEALEKLLHASRSAGLDALVEVHDQQEARIALDAGAGIIGVNNRDLATFLTDVRRTLEVAPLVRGKAILVSESGIRTREDVMRLEEAGVNAVLIGETLVRAADPREVLRTLLGA